MSNIIYQTTDFQKALWTGHKLVDTSAESSEREGRQRYEAFPSFAEGVFHCFFADNPQRVEEPPEGFEHLRKLDSEMNKVPEYADLREMTVGDDRRAGVAAAAMLDTLLSTVTPPDQQIQDPRSDEEAMEYLERLLEGCTDEEEILNLEQSINELQDSAEAKKAAAEAAARLMDETEIRQAIRQASRAAAQSIKEEEEGTLSYGAGADPHGGRTERRQIAKKLAPLIAGNERARRIAEVGRRLQHFAAEEQRKKTRKGCGERVGSYQGNDLKNMMPREMIWAAPVLRGVFFRKYAERDLACVKKQEREKKNKGPIVLLLDSSGSMKTGDADIWAAGVALAFLSIAAKQKRACVLMHFGTAILREDRFQGAMDPAKIFESVNFFGSSGGTAFEAPLDAAIAQIEADSDFKDADIVMVTDGKAPITDDWLKEWEKKRERLGFHAYSILVGTSTSRETNQRFSDEVVHLAEAMKDDQEMHRFFGAV